MVRTVLLFVFVAFSHALQGQSDTLCWIGEISVEGARRTRESVILREVQLRVGDTLSLSALPGLVEESRLLLLSTGLFTTSKRLLQILGSCQLEGSCSHSG
jgi:hypothetical protein